MTVYLMVKRISDLKKDIKQKENQSLSIIYIYLRSDKSVKNPNEVLNAWLINIKHTCRAKYIVKTRKLMEYIH